MKKASIPIFPVIVSVLKIVIIVAVFAVIALFFLSSASPPACSLTGFFRSLYHSACVSSGGVELVCLSDFTDFEVPLLGCNPATFTYGKMSPEEFALQLGIAAQSCWTKFGSGEMNVLWGDGENPAICSKLTATLTGDINAAVISKAWSKQVYGQEYDCTQCENPCEEGYVCDLAKTSQCIKMDPTLEECFKEGKKLDCSIGNFDVVIYKGDDIGQGKIELFNKLEEYVCPDWASYRENACCDEKGTYTIPDESVDGSYTCDSGSPKPQCVYSDQCVGDPKLPEDFCEETESQISCLVCKHEDKMYKPNPCILTHKVTDPNCFKKTTMANYLEPGLKTFYSFKNKTDEALIIGPIENQFNISGRVSAMVEFIDSFTGSGKTSGMRTLPPECAAGIFVDTCDYCEDECIGGVFRGLTIYSGASEIIGGTGFGIAASYTIMPEAGDFVVSSYVTYGGNVLDRLYQCALCLNQGASEAFGLQPDIKACSDKMIICLYEVPE